MTLTVQSPEETGAGRLNFVLFGLGGANAAGLSGLFSTTGTAYARFWNSLCCRNSAGSIVNLRLRTEGISLEAHTVD